MLAHIRHLSLLALATVGLVGLAPGTSAQYTITKAQRELVVFQADLGSEFLYEFMEDEGVNRAVNTLSPHYNLVRVRRDATATLSNLIAALHASASKSAIKAVDLVFMTHGGDELMGFSNYPYWAWEVRNRIQGNMTSAERAKLRMVFTTACFGSTHRNEWIESGFKCASGSYQIYADSAASFQPFLSSWAAGNRFSTAVSAANNADPLRVWDNGARAMYTLMGQPWAAAHVNSIRAVSHSSTAATNLTISKML